MSRPPLPPFTLETAIQKVRLAEDAWNGRDPARVALAYSPDSRWRNRSTFLQGRAQIEAFLTQKWQRELDYRLIKELWAFRGTASPCASPTSGTTPLANGFAATATRTGPSMAKA
jgi:nuclear transport factor 2 (NTF2) superfamily protein